MDHHKVFYKAIVEKKIKEQLQLEAEITEAEVLTYLSRQSEVFLGLGVGARIQLDDFTGSELFQLAHELMHVDVVQEVKSQKMKESAKNLSNTKNCMDIRLPKRKLWSVWARKLVKLRWECGIL